MKIGQIVLGIAVLAIMGYYPVETSLILLGGFIGLMLAESIKQYNRNKKQ